MSSEYIYLFVRKDLSAQQQIIQTAHAIHQVGQNVKSSDVPNAVLFGASDEDELMRIQSHLASNDVAFEMFFEPDVQAYTAIATHPIEGEKRKLMRKFKMM